MNKHKALQELNTLLSNVLILPQCEEEILKLVLGTGFEHEFIKCLSKCLTQLNEKGQAATKLDSFEKLKKAVNLYSMHLVGGCFNIRILYTFQNNDKILILAFYEREDKSKTDYTDIIPLAQKRLKYYLKSGGNIREE